MPQGYPYPAEFRANLVRRICAPGGPTVHQVSREEGVSKGALYDWVHKSRSTESMSKRRPETRRPQDWSPAEKLEAVLQAARLSDEELGTYLRENGLHEAHLDEWRQQAESGLGRAPSGSDKKLRKENQRLSKELSRKDRALAEAAALLVLSKKARALWGEEGENT